MFRTSLTGWFDGRRRGGRPQHVHTHVRTDHRDCVRHAFSPACGRGGGPGGQPRFRRVSPRSAFLPEGEFLHTTTPLSIFRRRASRHRTRSRTASSLSSRTWMAVSSPARNSRTSFAAMRLGSSEQPAHISLIRRRSRSIVSRAPASSGIYPRSPARCSDVNIDEEIEGAVTNRLTAGPSISAIRGAAVYA